MVSELEPIGGMWIKPLLVKVMLKKRIWSEQDLERLRALVLSGASAVRASVALKRPLKVVKLKARKIGVPFPYDSELKKERQRKLSSAAQRPVTSV